MAAEQEWYKKITIVVPTYNTPDFLKRNLSYLDSYHFGLKVIVADSSREENKVANKNIIGKARYLQITYLNYPSEIKPFLKWLKALKRVKTKYVVLCADDDFVSILSLKKASEFLEGNPGYDAAEGKNIFFINFEMFKKHFLSWKNGDAWDSYDSDIPSQRVNELARDYQPILYAVYRTKTLVYSFEQALKTDSIEFPFGEFIPAFVTLIKSKVKRLDFFYAARDKKIDFQRSNPPANFIQSYKEEGTLKEKYFRFRENLIKEMSQATKLDRHCSEKMVACFINQFLKTQQYRKYSGVIKKRMRNRIFFVRLYFLYRWILIDIKKYFQLKKMTQENPDFKRMAWFIKHCRVDPPTEEKFIK